MMLARRIVALAGLAACAPTPKHPIPVAVVVDGDRAAVGSLGAVTGLELHELALPAPSAPPPDASAALVAGARTAYAKGDFDACRAQLDKLAIDKLLARGERALPARALAIETACAWGAMDKTAAAASAARLAAFGLDLPDVSLPPDVERVLGDAIAAAGAAKRAPFAVSGVAGARLVVDGRPAGCALPCAIDLPPGDHVLAVDADGYEPALRVVRTPDAASAQLEQTRAPAELAAQQWRARVGRGLPPADVTGAALLGALGGTRVAHLHGESRVSGSLVVDGKLVATATRDRGDSSALVRELAYDGGVLPRPAVWQRPWFWIAASGAVALVAGTIIAVTYQRPIDTSLSF
jgi:hypothetical protein